MITAICKLGRIKHPIRPICFDRDVFDALVGQVEEDFLDDLGEEGFEMHGKIDNQKLEGPLDEGAGTVQNAQKIFQWQFSFLFGYKVLFSAYSGLFARCICLFIFAYGSWSFHLLVDC